MGSSDEPSDDEQRAFAIVGAVTGAVVQPRDGKLAPPRTPDAELIYPDGRSGWLEVSTLGVSGELELLSLLPKEAMNAPGDWHWIVVVDRRRQLRRAMDVAAEVIQACEREGVASPHLLSEDARTRSPELRWAATDERVLFFGVVLPPGARVKEPSLTFKADDWLATSRFGSADLVSTLNANFDGPTLRGKIDKLLARDGSERHLYLRVTKEGIGERNLFLLAAYAFDVEDEILPDPVLDAPDPLIPEGITALWLDSRWGTRVTRWTRGVGWDHPVMADT